MMVPILLLVLPVTFTGSGRCTARLDCDPGGGVERSSLRVFVFISPVSAVMRSKVEEGWAVRKDLRNVSNKVYRFLS